MGSRFKFRYYTSWKDDLNREVISLLEIIRTKYSIDYTIRRIALKYDPIIGAIPDEDDEMSIYKEEFLPRAKVLKSRIGLPIRRVLRSRRGHFYVSGILAITNLIDQVEWLPTFYDPLYKNWKKYDEQNPTTIGFLKWIIDRGEEAIKYIESKIYTRPQSIHERLIEEFIKRKIIPGGFKREVQIGGAFIISRFGHKVRIWSMRIDLVVYEPSGITWVIEVEPELNALSLGQVLIYKELYKMENPTKKIKTAIVCCHADPLLKEIAEKYIDRVIEIPIEK